MLIGDTQACLILPNRITQLQDVIHRIDGGHPDCTRAHLDRDLSSPGVQAADAPVQYDIAGDQHAGMGVRYEASEVYGRHHVTPDHEPPHLLSFTKTCKFCYAHSSLDK